MNDIKEDFFHSCQVWHNQKWSSPGTEYKLMFNFDLQIYQLIKF